MASTVHDQIKREFSKQAVAFERSKSIANREYLEWMLNHLDLRADSMVLDVAAGTGHLSRALAEHVRRIVAVDLTIAMLVRGKREADAMGLANIRFEQGLAERLPHAHARFDLALARFAIHHLAEPRIVLLEMARVVRSGGTVGIIDLVAPDDPLLARTYNDFERLRDPSHIQALTVTDLGTLLSEAGLRITRTAARDIEVNVTDWLSLTQPPRTVQDRIRAQLNGELHGEGLTGARPFVRDGELMFGQTWAIVVGAKFD